jgi:hypothetical protein
LRTVLLGQRVPQGSDARREAALVSVLPGRYIRQCSLRLERSLVCVPWGEPFGNQLALVPQRRFAAPVRHFRPSHPRTANSQARGLT